MNCEIVDIIGFLPVALVEDVCALIEACDQAHTYEHVYDVVTEANILSNGDRDAVIAAFMHDITRSEDPENHHASGAVLAMALLEGYGIECDREAVYYAIYEHRNSYKGEYSSEVSQCVAAADRGIPDANKALVRSYQYARGLGKDHASAVYHAWDHIRYRYLGTELKVPEFYLQYYKSAWYEMLEELRNERLEDTAKRLAHFA